jgi:hypothetical protein
LKEAIDVLVKFGPSRQRRRQIDNELRRGLALEGIEPRVDLVRNGPEEAGGQAVPKLSPGRATGTTPR